MSKMIMNFDTNSGFFYDYNEAFASSSLKGGEKMSLKDNKKSCRGRTSQADVKLRKEVKQMQERQKALVIALQSINQRVLLIEKELFEHDKL